PVARIALERAMRGEGGLRQDLHAHVLGGTVVGGREPRFVDDHDALGVGDALAVELRVHALRARFEADLVVAHERLVDRRCASLQAWTIECLYCVYAMDVIRSLRHEGSDRAPAGIARRRHRSRSTAAQTVEVRRNPGAPAAVCSSSNGAGFASVCARRYHRQRRRFTRRSQRPQEALSARDRLWAQTFSLTRASWWR